ncbi:MAG: homoaconitate hydratase [Deltaproteobacteria bacterium]|nr:homoaconitate hydratase [Deltaproteobacteria bacterium]
MAGQTMLEKILSAHTGKRAEPGAVLDVKLDTRVARDFGGANVVGHLEQRGLGLADPGRTAFTFDCNPAGSDQKYAANQQRCRLFARRQGVRVFDLGSGIGTHLAIDQGLAWPGSTFVSTDSHANILGAIGAFGQGMGDIDIAAAFAHGKIWFEVPPTVQVLLRGQPGPAATAKDIALKILSVTGASGLLGCAAEVVGEIVDQLSLDARLTISSLGTEMGAIILMFAPSPEVVAHCRAAAGGDWQPVLADADARYARTLEVDIAGLEPLISRPGHPEDVVTVAELRGTAVDSTFVGSCTNGRWEDLAAVARLLEGRRIANDMVLKVVPATDAVWRRALEAGLLRQLKQGGALIASAGCAGCAEGQIGQNGPGEVTVSTGNRNFAGKQGKGQVYLASPETAVASAIMGAIATADDVRSGRQVARQAAPAAAVAAKPKPATDATGSSPATVVEGRLFVVPVDNVDTDMIFHNRHLAITDPAQMAPHAFGNLEGYQHFPQWAQPGDVVWAGSNFGCGSSRQQAVDALLALGVGALVASSYGAIYWRNAVNGGLPALTCAALPAEVGAQTGDRVRIDLATGRIELIDKGQVIEARPLGEVPLSIYKRGGLL